MVLYTSRYYTLVYIIQVYNELLLEQRSHFVEKIENNSKQNTTEQIPIQIVISIFWKKNRKISEQKSSEKRQLKQKIQNG